MIAKSAAHKNVFEVLVLLKQKKNLHILVFHGMIISLSELKTIKFVSALDEVSLATTQISA